MFGREKLASSIRWWYIFLHIFGSVSCKQLYLLQLNTSVSYLQVNFLHIFKVLGVITKIGKALGNC